MDSNTKPTANAMGSSISSLTSSFRKLEVDTDDGQINRLPNELMQQIMAKLGLDSDVRKLFPLRLVSTRWRALIEDYCRMKKLLFVHFHPNNTARFDFTSYFKNASFRLANSKNFACLFFSTETAAECLSSLLNMFPNIEQLSIYCGYYLGYERTLDNSLEVYIKSLDSLKLLDLNGSSLTQLYPALSKLEHFSYNCPGHKDDLLQLIIKALQHRLTSLNSVLTFELCVHIDENFHDFTYGEKFTRVLSAIFPNLVELDLTFEAAYSAKSKALAVQRQIEQHLNRFSNLRKHKIDAF